MVRPAYFMEAQRISNIPFPLPHPQDAVNGRTEHEKEAQLPCPGPLLSNAPPLSKIERLEKQAAQPCERVAVLIELAEYILEAGRNERAIELLERAIRCHSQDSKPVLLLGKAWEAEGEYDKALETYVEALQRGVAGAEIEAALFRQDFLLNAYPRSVTELSVVAVRKKNAQLWRQLARVCEINADYNDALTFLTEALRENAQDIATLCMLARIAERRQEMDEAATWHRRILEINPRLPLSNHFLAQQHYARGEYAAALPYLSRLRLKERDNRTYKLSWLLAYVQVSGVEDLDEQLEEIKAWQDLTPEEQALAQELFLLAGERSLEVGRARAEQYILQALHLAPSANGALLLAAVEPGKTEQAFKKVFETLMIGERGEAEHSPVATLASSAEDILSYPQDSRPAQPTWVRRVLRRVAARRGETSSSEENNH